MSRIGEDYIWLTKPPRKRAPLRWLGFALAIPLVAGAVSLSTWNKGEPGKELANSLMTPVGTAQAADDLAALDETIELIPQEAREVVTPVKSKLQSPPLKPALRASADNLDLVELPEPDWKTIEIQSGDTLSLAFERYNLSYNDSLKIAHLPTYGSRFTRGLKTGDTFKVQADKQGRVQALDYPLDKITTLQVRRTKNGFDTSIAEAQVEHRTAYATGTIDTSFYVDALEAGLSDNLIMNLAQIYGWDIDFVLDIRAGDRFIVVYDQIYYQGEKIRDGKILAAEFRNQGRNLRALRYTNHEGNSAYYTPEGRIMKKAFLRVPMDQFRVSSPFNLRRKHPVLNRIRAHEGTDYAAPTGTPIKAAGDGRIAFRGRKGGYGNLIEIRHNSRTSTRYGHMSRFRSGFGVGSYVKQGQVIGYVGQSGLATGPHLHYEFRINGAPKNPETVPLPKAEPLPQKYMAEFKRHSAPFLAQLEALERIQVASNSSAE